MNFIIFIHLLVNSKNILKRLCLYFSYFFFSRFHLCFELFFHFFKLDQGHESVVLVHIIQFLGPFYDVTSFTDNLVAVDVFGVRVLFFKGF